jgi:hypothetical protein
MQHFAQNEKYKKTANLPLLIIMIQVKISPPSLLEKGIKVEKVDNLNLFKFTDELQERLEQLLEQNKMNLLTSEETEELINLNELDRFFTYLNSLLIAQE